MLTLFESGACVNHAHPCDHGATDLRPRLRPAIENASLLYFFRVRCLRKKRPSIRNAGEDPAPPVPPDVNVGLYLRLQNLHTLGVFYAEVCDHDFGGHPNIEIGWAGGRGRACLHRWAFFTQTPVREFGVLGPRKVTSPAPHLPYGIKAQVNNTECNCSHKL